jgi:hypothetical protein
VLKSLNWFGFAVTTPAPEGQGLSVPSCGPNCSTEHTEKLVHYPTMIATARVTRFKGEPTMAPAPPPLLPEEQQAFHAEYKKYYEMKRGNFFQSLKGFAGVWDCLQLLCDIWQREMGDLQTRTDQNHLLPKMLFTAAHARYLTAIELSFSCCIGDAYSVLRDGIESISHAYKIAHEPAQIPVWTNKHKSEADEEAYDKVFTHSKKKNLYPDKDGMNRLHTYYAHFCEMATHSSVTSLGKNFKDASTPGNVKWEYHYFETDANNLAVFLFTLLQVSAHMEEAFFASFESRLKLDPTLVDMRGKFTRDTDVQRKYLKATYKLP